MICPHCGYKHGHHWNKDDKWERVEGENGEFFELTNAIQAKRGYGYNEQTRDVYGCPSCNKLFME
ncbi:MAG TPA: hypothetical protein VFM18_11655 [Methanosarcina sp.]|nr:hypothetical protein [Methanosarcina sp.]